MQLRGGVTVASQLEPVIPAPLPAPAAASAAQGDVGSKRAAAQLTRISNSCITPAVPPPPVQPKHAALQKLGPETQLIWRPRLHILLQMGEAGGGEGLTSTLASLQELDVSMAAQEGLVFRAVGGQAPSVHLQQARAALPGWQCAWQPTLATEQASGTMQNATDVYIALSPGQRLPRDAYVQILRVVNEVAIRQAAWHRSPHHPPELITDIAGVLLSEEGPRHAARHASALVQAVPRNGVVAAFQHAWSIVTRADALLRQADAAALGQVLPAATPLGQTWRTALAMLLDNANLRLVAPPFPLPTPPQRLLARRFMHTAPRGASSVRVAPPSAEPLVPGTLQTLHAAVRAELQHIGLLPPDATRDVAL